MTLWRAVRIFRYGEEGVSKPHIDVGLLTLAPLTAVAGLQALLQERENEDGRPNWRWFDLEPSAPGTVVVFGGEVCGCDA